MISEDSDQPLHPCAFYSLQTIQRGINEQPYNTEWMYRLNLVFAGHRGLTVGFVVHWLNYGKELSCQSIYGKYRRYIKYHGPVPNDYTLHRSR